MKLIEKLIGYSIILFTVFALPKLFGIQDNTTTLFYGGFCLMVGASYMTYYMIRKLKELDKK
ncbi:MAG: hypothetical protein L3J07_02950 [Candidatus Magasanikbacteria bacterium]|nr:hypothetical protein [Candidatus Magasanikbacteria bacterium]